jgi:hypothetical protein
VLPKTFCILPFVQATIANDGKVKLCTHAHASEMLADGRPLSLHWATFGQMWNCDYLRLVRRRMLEGLEVEACAACYATESDGGTSLRQSMNLHAGCRSESSGEDSLLAKAEAIVRQNGGHAPPPSALHLWLGNLCNMKCRMCSPMFSSMVASDTVQARWLGELTRSESLLPAYLDGVDYMGFGELVRHGERWAREVTRPNATISLPSSVVLHTSAPAPPFRRYCRPGLWDEAIWVCHLSGAQIEANFLSSTDGNRRIRCC